MEKKTTTIHADENSESPDFLGALARGLSVITAFDAQHHQMTLSDIAKIVDLPRATVRRALFTLGHLGYVENEGRLFRLSPGILRLASAYLQSNSLSAVLQPACERICKLAQETCSAAVLDDQDVVIVARASPRRATAMGIGMGYRIPAASGALGRTLLAALPDDQLSEFIERLKPVRYTPQTIIDKRGIRRSILEARKHGYAYSDQEVEVGYRSIAVPLLAYDGRTAAALHIGALADSTPTKKMLNEFLP
ncbi:IclR family transcriptional regulator domain-containing protein [Novosphingobium resinovorum]|uniref:IclR family transcriptional regulator n=1 Tax=Novosphingobium resinovorum TaxID=158500 RepID=A0A1D8AGU4_9SPHN|nr:IclR family transcriptional regulator [Novosphingobium resinovorum]